MPGATDMAAAAMAPPKMMQTMQTSLHGVLSSPQRAASPMGKLGMSTACLRRRDLGRARVTLTASPTTAGAGQRWEACPANENCLSLDERRHASNLILPYNQRLPTLRARVWDL